MLITGFWFLEKTSLPDWSKPPIIGLLGTPARFLTGSTGRPPNFYHWGSDLRPLELADAPRRTSISWNIPAVALPGLDADHALRRGLPAGGAVVVSQIRIPAVVGYIYPFAAMIAALLLMISPISNLLLRLGPIFQKGSPIEWIMLAFHLVVPSALLIFLWRGRMTKSFTRDDLPIFLVPTVLHLSDIVFTVIGGHFEILWIVLLASFAQTALLLFAY